MERREFLKVVAGSIMASQLAKGDEGEGNMKLGRGLRKRGYLKAIMPTREQVANFIAREQGPEKLSKNDGWTFDADLGWVLCDAVRGRSVDGSKGFYSYEADGARKVINFPDGRCRIHTYGNSFTHCDQVSDGETWQEYLAGHLQEPVRNYGVGGYGVYQAYRRLLKTENENPAEYIILNIWDDDHYRNLDAWRSIRFGTRTPCGYTLPYLKVNVEKETCEQVENIFKKGEEVYRLCDEDFVWRTFRDDAVLARVVATRMKKPGQAPPVERVAVGFGIPKAAYGNAKSVEQIRWMHTEAALFATKNIVTWTEEFVNRTGKKLMVILSFGRYNIAEVLMDNEPFDKSFTEWLKGKPYPVIDMRDAFREQFTRFKGHANTFLRQYYIGHHNPAGNFFTAWAIKKRIVEWLEPKPLPYR